MENARWINRKPLRDYSKKVKKRGSKINSLRQGRRGKKLGEDENWL